MKEPAITAEPDNRAELQTPDTLAAALQFVKQARHDLNIRTANLDKQKKEWDAEQERYATFFSTAPDGYFVTDAFGIIRDASRVAAALLHIPPAQLSGKPLINFIAMEDRPPLRRALISLQKGTNKRG